MTTRNPSSRRESGLTMIEVLVGIAILVIAVVLALVLYDAARKSFKKGENVTEQQQAVRIAFDKLNADLRMAGYNYNPDGDINRPDEQIEAAYDTAVVLRADLDAGTPDATVPETALATGGAFATVSTGNDEIVTYVLAKPDGSSADTLTFFADLHNPRNGAVQQVDIHNVALVQNDPPYTLYRITLSNTDGSPVRTPLVENVRSMTFRYFALSGAQVNSTFDLASTADDIGGAETTAPKLQRDSIRRITVDLVGLTRDPDLGWADQADTNPKTRAFRKFELKGDVSPRNLGMKGIRDLMADVVPPTTPGTPSLYPGHCGGLYVTWPPNPGADQVSYYRVNYGTSPTSPIGQRAVADTIYYLGGLDNATLYYVTIEAIDAAGNISAPSAQRSTTTTNTTTPKAPTDLSATTDLNSSVKLAWTAVKDNTGNTAGDPESPLCRDLGGYRVYRGTSPGFTPSAGNRKADESIVGVQVSPIWLDVTAINCKQYYYRTTAVDKPCGLESAPTDATAGRAFSDKRPTPPPNVQAFVQGVHVIRVTWQATTKDVDGNPIGIDTYKIWRSRYAVPQTDGSDPNSVEYEQIGVATGVLYYDDSPSPTPPDGSNFYYRVSAIDDCPNESDLSNAARATCSFTGTVQITQPSNGQAVAGAVPVSASVVGGSDTYTKATFTYTHSERGVLRTQEVTGPGPTWTDTWLATPPGNYTITVTVENSASCTRTATISVTAGDIVGCCLSPPNPTQNPVTMTCLQIHQNQKDCSLITYQVINNGCRTAVSIESLDVTWMDRVGNGALLMSVAFDGTTIWNVSPFSSSPASTTFNDPKPVIALNRTSANPVQVHYRLTATTSDSFRDHGTTVYRQDTFTTTYGFRLLDEAGLPTAITGTCGPSQGMFGNLIVEPN